MILLEAGKKFPAGLYLKKLPPLNRKKNFLREKVPHISKAKFYRIIYFQSPFRRLSGMVLRSIKYGAAIKIVMIIISIIGNRHTVEDIK